MDFLVDLVQLCKTAAWQVTQKNELQSTAIIVAFARE
jgi:hypothetical protein